VTVLVTGEKLAQRPRRITRLAAIALSIAAAGAIYTPRVALVAGTLLGLAMAVGGRRRTRRRHDPAPGSSGPPASIQRQTFPI
jgi:hypothetical protein